MPAIAHGALLQVSSVASSNAGADFARDCLAVLPDRPVSGNQFTTFRTNRSNTSPWFW